MNEFLRILSRGRTRRIEQWYDGREDNDPAENAETGDRILWGLLILFVVLILGFVFS